jgi:hypothetical protein
MTIGFGFDDDDDDCMPTVRALTTAFCSSLSSSSHAGSRVDCASNGGIPAEGKAPRGVNSTLSRPCGLPWVLIIRVEAARRTSPAASGTCISTPMSSARRSGGASVLLWLEGTTVVA